jgi:heme-degrading monooxygenase HmoA
MIDGRTRTFPPLGARFARIWRGRTTRHTADAYEQYWLQTGSAPLIARGALSVQMLREDRATDSEFVTISWWESLEAMAPDGDPYLAHHLPRDEDYLIELPERVEILRLLDNSEKTTRVSGGTDG